MLYNKCVKEPNYLDLYMELIDQLIIKFKSSKLKPKEFNFKKMWLEQCQISLQSKENDILLMAPSGEDEVLMQKKERIMGSVKLIAALFIRGAIPDDYVKLSLDKLMNKTMDDNIESVITLMQGIGRKLYEYFAFEAKQTTIPKKPKIKVKKFTKEIFDSYLDELIKIKQTDSVSAKTKFLIQDLIDARDKVWSLAFNKFPVTKEAGKMPTKIVEYRKKVKPEEKAAELIEKPEMPNIEISTEKISVEESIFGKSLEKYHKSKLEEKTRVFFNISKIINS